MNYPEHEKLKLIKDKSQCVGEFLDWAWDEHRLQLVTMDEHGEYQYTGVTTRQLLADFFEIDEDRLEDEKQQMLELLRAAYE